MGKYQVEVYKCFNLTIRKSGSVSSKAIDWVNAGQKFTTSKQSNGWSYIDEKKGWANSKYLKVIKKTDPKATTPPKTNTEKDKADAKKKAAAAKAKADAAAAARGGMKAVNFKGTAAIESDSAEATGNYNFEQPASATLEGIYNDETMEFPLDATATTTPPATDQVKALSDSSFQAASRNSGGGAKGNKKSGATSFSNDYSSFESKFTRLRRAHGLIDHDKHGLNWHQYHSFNRFRNDFPDSILTRTTSHVFFTRPALNILTNDGEKLRGSLAYDPFWTSVYATNPSALKALTSHWSKNHDFMPILSNLARTFEIPDEILKTTEHGESLIGHKMNYGLNSIESSTAGTFNVQYIEDPNYNIYTIHKAWVEYISQVSRGALAINPKHRYLKILDYASSAYYFLCAADGETILYWAKYYGTFPTNVPASAASWTKGAAPKIHQYDINYAYSMKEEYNVASLYEFNRLKKVQTGTSGNFEYEPSYRPKTRTAPKAFTGAPFVQSVIEGNKRVYKLRYRED